jgi:hypothetical protein
VIYEVGVLFFPRGSPRNGADVWLRSFLDWIGFGQYFLLPLMVVGALLGWHYLRRDPWQVRRGVLGGMLLESLLWAWLLLMFASVFGRWSTALALPPASLGLSLVPKMIAYMGAGIYEELLFRLLLIPPAIGCLRALGLPKTVSALAAIVATSVLFSAAHYVGAHGDVWRFDTFTFRFVAGVLFAALFQYRGFGIAAGSHALYDVATAFW